MMYIEAPNTYSGQKPSLFLAGGITGCPDWQQQMASKLVDKDIVVFNPRRKNFPISDPRAAHKQVKWEHDYLRKAGAISFWFSPETLNPIVLYELGTWSMTNKPIFVGIHPKYQRKRDVELQMKFVRPAVKIVYSIDALVRQVRNHFK